MSSVEEIVAQLRSCLDMLPEDATYVLSDAVRQLDQLLAVVSEPAQGSDDLRAMRDQAEMARQHVEAAQLQVLRFREKINAYLAEIGAGGLLTLSARSPIELVTADTKENQAPPEWFIATATDVCVDGWQDTTASRISELLDLADRHRWEEFNPDPEATDCRALAQVARWLKGQNGLVHEKIGEAVAGSAAAIGLPSILVAVTKRLVERAPLPTDPIVATAVRAIRVLGVFLCAVDGGPYPFARCECLRDLAVGMTEDGLRWLLQKGL
jgi:hypothetical protein